MTKKEKVLEYLKKVDEVTVKSTIEYLEDEWFSGKEIKQVEIRALLNKLVYYGNAKKTSDKTYVYRPKVSPIVHFAMNRGDRTDLEQVKEAVCHIFDVDKHDLSSKNRERPIPDARKAYCFLAAKYVPEASTIAVGISINKDHSTVVTARQRALELIDYEKSYRQTVYACEKVIEENQVSLGVRNTITLNEKEIGFYYDKPDKLAKHYDLEQ